MIEACRASGKLLDDIVNWVVVTKISVVMKKGLEENHVHLFIKHIPRHTSLFGIGDGKYMNRKNETK